MPSATGWINTNYHQRFRQLVIPSRIISIFDYGLGCNRRQGFEFDAGYAGDKMGL